MTTDTEHLWQEMHTGIRAFVGRRIRQAADVDDVVQRVFLRVHQGLSSLRDEERVHAWVYRTATHAIADYYRGPVNRREVASGGLEDFAEGPVVDTEREGADEQTAEREFAACVQPLLRLLSEADREALALIDVEDVTQVDAAQKLGLTVPGMKSRIQRARRRLRTVTYLLGIVVLMITSGADIAASVVSWRFVMPQVAAILTAAASAAAAFESTVPGSSRRLLVLPAATTTVWNGSLVSGAVQEWTQLEGASLTAPGEWWCVAMILIGGALPGLGLLLMLRHGAPLTPRLTTALGALAAAALANVGACVLHPHQNYAATLVWHGSTSLVAVALAAASSRFVLTWEKRSELAADEP